MPFNFRLVAARQILRVFAAAFLMCGFDTVAAEFADATAPAEQVRPFDLFLLLGQSNMAGLGELSEGQKPDPRIFNMSMTNDQWVVARDPLHVDLAAGRIGVGPGMSFARAVLEQQPGSVIGLIPGAVCGSWIDLWEKEAPRSFYDGSIRRAHLALATASAAKPRIRAVLWLQGESDSTEERFGDYERKLFELIDNLRADLNDPDLPFIACTIGSFIDPRSGFTRTQEINQILLNLPDKRSFTACVDARDLTGHIGDRLHYNAESQRIIGKRFAEKYNEVLISQHAGSCGGTGRPAD
jgi:hypothetical protein